MKKVLSKCLFITLVSLISISAFAWTEYKQSSLSAIVSNNVEALTNSGDDDIHYLTSDHSVYTKGNKIFFIGYSNRALLSGCNNDDGVCMLDDSASDGSGWLSWLSGIGSFASIISVIIALLPNLFAGL